MSRVSPLRRVGSFVSWRFGMLTDVLVEQIDSNISGSKEYSYLVSTNGVDNDPRSSPWYFVKYGGRGAYFSRQLLHAFVAFIPTLIVLAIKPPSLR